MSNTFEVNRIINDKVTSGTSYYLIEWKDTTTVNILSYQCYKKEMKRVIKINNKYIIKWKNSWLKFDNIKESCDELLGAYLLLKLYNYSTQN